ncbi:MAG: alpha/beta fold hydrolase [Patescibacteria group bacterium]
MRALRTRFGKDIVAEFLPPRRRSQNVIILCGGMPGYPSAKFPLLDFFSKKGYWVFSPRYRGSWESGGRFLRISPDRDVIAVIDQLPLGFKDLWNNKTYRVKPDKIYLIGGSFGGPAVILSSRDARITKAIAISPVVDFRVRSKVDPIDWLGKFVKEAFGEGYRYSMKDWNKLKNGRFYNPVAYSDDLDGKKLFIIHAKDDDVVAWKPVQKFARRVGSQLMLLRSGGHLSMPLIVKPRFYKRIHKFLKSK